MKPLNKLNISPAPWKVDDYTSVVRVNDSDGCGLLNAAQNDPRNKANARLIAAAPELYEALRELYDCIELTDWNNKDYWPFTKKADAALAKAAGGEVAQ